MPVFAVVGGGARDAVDELSLRHELRLVDSPRHATVLLVAGWLPRSLVPSLAQVHDQLPHPRATVWWTGTPLVGLTGLDWDPVSVDGGDPTDAIVETHRGLLTGVRSSERHLLGDRLRPRWRGVGPHGQGGEGMMGGEPYGRPMPVTGPDRDGLTLDRLALTVGPFFAHFPPGLALDVVLQGDVVQEARPVPNPFAVPDPVGARVGGAVASGQDEFTRAVETVVAVRDLELVRARHHLRAVVRMLRVHGLEPMARRTLRLAHEVHAVRASDVATLRRTLERSRWPRWAMDGVGVIDRRRLPDAGLGPVTRAAGVAEDGRAGDPSYAGLGFEPITHDTGDALARFRQRLAEAEQALGLALRAGDRLREPGGVVEGPRGRLTVGSDPTERLLGLVDDVLVGMEWGDALTTLVGLDLDLEAAAGRHLVGVG